MRAAERYRLSNFRSAKSRRSKLNGRKFDANFKRFEHPAFAFSGLGSVPKFKPHLLILEADTFSLVASNIKR